MSFTSSSSRDFVEICGRRKIPSIPSDQQTLLADSNAWAAQLKNQPHGLAHVPGHVVETVKEAYINRANGATNSTPRPKRKTRSPSASTSRKRMRDDTPNTQEPGTPIAWTQSPESHLQPRQPVKEPTEAVQSSIVLETPKGARLQKSPLRVCPSSDAAEEDLEMEYPHPLDQPNEPSTVARRLARLQPTVESPIPSANRTMATPPCAQPSMPTQAIASGTDTNGDKSTNHDHAERQDRDRVRFKSIPFDHSGKKIQQPPNRLAATKTFAPMNSSISTSSSSMVPATQKDSNTQDSIIESIEDNGDAGKSITVTATAQSMFMKSAVIEGSLDSSSEDEPTSTPSQRKSNVAIHNGFNSSKPPASSPRGGSAVKRRKPAPEIGLNELGLEPYEVFKWRYPQYQNNRVDFVKACLCLKYLASKKLLRQCLFDEFIGVFGGYLEYVRTSQPGQATLVALEWFNIQTSEPSFTSNVVDYRANEEILRSYPEEVAEATRMIADRSNSASRGSSVGPDYSNDQPRTANSGQAILAEGPEPLNLDGAMESDGVIPWSPTGPRYELPQMMTREPSHKPRQQPLQKAAHNAPLTSAKRAARRSIPASSMPKSTQPSKPSPVPTPSSSRPRAILTQAPPPPSPRIPRSTAAIPATIVTPGTEARAPRRSQYSGTLWWNAKTKSNSTTRTAHDHERQRRLKEHFGKRRSMESASVRSSSRLG